MSSTYIPAALRDLVSRRARDCCEYCLTAERISFERHHVDHVIAKKHRGNTIEDNLALACSLCNWLKGTDIASIDHETGSIVRLYNPRIDEWGEHFRVECGRYVGITPSARATISMMRLNSEERLEERLS